MQTELNEIDLQTTPMVHLRATNIETLQTRLKDVIHNIEGAPGVTAAREALNAAKLQNKKANDALMAVQRRINELTKSIRTTQDSLENELVEHYQAEGPQTEVPRPVRDLIDKKSEQQIASSTITSLVERRIPVAQIAEYRAAGTYARSRAEELTRVGHEHFKRITEALRDVIESEGVLSIDTSTGFTGMLMAAALEVGLEANMFFKNADEAERKWKAMHADIATKSMARR